MNVALPFTGSEGVGTYRGSNSQSTRIYTKYGDNLGLRGTQYREITVLAQEMCLMTRRFHGAAQNQITR